MSTKTFGSSPIGSPAAILTKLEFCVHHDIYPMVEEFPIEKVNEAFDTLKKGKQGIGLF